MCSNSCWTWCVAYAGYMRHRLYLELTLLYIVPFSMIYRVISWYEIMAHNIHVLSRCWFWTYLFVHNIYSFPSCNHLMIIYDESFNYVIMVDDIQVTWKGSANSKEVDSVTRVASCSGRVTYMFGTSPSGVGRRTVSCLFVLQSQRLSWRWQVHQIFFQK